MHDRFRSLEDLKVRQSPDASCRYFVYGTGPEVLLLVNAFGLSLDFWQKLVESLRDDFTIIALDDSSPLQDETRIPRTYYSTESSIEDFVSAATTALAAEGVKRCHVVSWCSGAKVAMELAHAKPGLVSALSFITPSFAGVEGFTGCDSAYEQNLHTMCKIVHRMPKAAANMAQSMTAMMSKSTQNLSATEPNTAGLADGELLPLLYQPFSDGDNMSEFSRQLLRFRAHDIRPRLESESLQVPMLLITGGADTTTSSPRAKDICGRLANVVGFEIHTGSHYLLHQHSALVAALLREFLKNGIDVNMSNPQLERCVFQQPLLMVAGEI